MCLRLRRVESPLHLALGLRLRSLRLLHSEPKHARGSCGRNLFRPSGDALQLLVGGVTGEALLLVSVDRRFF